jgi:TolB protein
MKWFSTALLILSISLSSCQRQYDESLQIVYRREFPGSIKQIMIMDEDGSNQHQITYTTNNDNPSWSADTEKIVFSYNNFLHTMNPDGTGLEQVNAYISFYPTWSPDGQKIVFYSNAFTADQEVYSINPDGTGLINLTNNAAADLFPSWFPDGKKIAFLRTNDIYSMNSDGTNQNQITFTAGKVSVSVSPDGSRFAYESGSHIWVVNSDGTNPVNLTLPYTTANRASWSPSGEKIVFATATYPREICVINADGSGFIQLTSNGDDEDTPCFIGKPR